MVVVVVVVAVVAVVAIRIVEVAIQEKYVALRGVWWQLLRALIVGRVSPPPPSAAARFVQEKYVALKGIGDSFREPSYLLSSFFPYR